MWKKFFKYLGIVLIGIVLILGILWGIFYREISLLVAVLNTDTKKIDYLIDKKKVNPQKISFNINLISFYLIDSKDKANPNFVSFLLKKGVQPNQDAGDYYPPLNWAIIANNPEVVKLLISYGADVNHYKEGKGRPLGLAVRYKNCEIVKFLIDSGAILDGDRFEKNMREKLKDCYK